MKKLTHEQISAKKPAIDEVRGKDRNPIYVLLDNVRSLHNVGAIFRSADAVLVEKVFLCGITGRPPRKEISKTALGAEELVPWEYFEEAGEAIEALKALGVKIVVVELAEDSVSYFEAVYDFPVCFVFGHEVEGISEEVMAMADMAVDLPMLGRANSLNVATCFGIVVYDALVKIIRHEK